MPTDIRTRSSVRPRSSRTAAGIAAWDMKHGRLMRDFTLPECKKGNGNSRSRVQLGQMVKASLLEGIEFVWDAHRSWLLRWSAWWSRRRALREPMNRWGNWEQSPLPLPDERERKCNRHYWSGQSWRSNKLALQHGK
jgi:hypothetical protein